MRPRWFNLLAAVCVVSCGTTPVGTPASAPEEPASRRAVAVNPAKIVRLRTDFPPGYEVADVTGGASPPSYWGFGGEWTADPPQCAGLANPIVGDAPPDGLSGSGPGGIVYAVVATSAAPVVLDPAVVAQCARWSMAGGRTTATVDLTPAPAIDGVATVAMSTASRTVVEGGTETQSVIQTVSAYLGEYLVFVALVTDPGATQPPLPSDFAATLLVKAVATLRG